MPRRRRTSRRRTPVRRKTSYRRKSYSRASTKRKLVGFTKMGGKYRLVFKKGKGKPLLGTKKFSSKKSMLLAARKKLTK